MLFSSSKIDEGLSTESAYAKLLLVSGGNFRGCHSALMHQKEPKISKRFSLANIFVSVDSLFMLFTERFFGKYFQLRCTLLTKGFKREIISSRLKRL